MNPFVTSGYAGPKFFCDREEETVRLLKMVSEGTSVTLTSIRRMGKTGLIRHVLSQLPKNIIGVYIDIQPAETLGEFLNIMATALVNSVPEKSKPGKVIWQFVKTLRPVISFDPLSGFPQITIDTHQRNPQPDIDSIFNFIESSPSRFVIAIDEFQQILAFPENNVDAWLRSKIQHLKNISFIFSGSQQHLIEQLFSNPSKPFYRSTVFFKLKKIPLNTYKDFVLKHFIKAGRSIPSEIADDILEWSDCHTYYVQLIFHQIYSTEIEKITDSVWKSEAVKLIDDSETIFYNYRRLLSSSQWKLLKAIASEKKVFFPTSKDFMQNHKLTTSATVLQSLKSLQSKEMIYQDYDENGRSFYSVYDLLFRQWIKNSVNA